MKYFAILSSCLLCMSCTPFGGFKPPPDAWTYYRGSGMTEREVYIAMMECGWPYPDDLTYVPTEVKVKLGIDFRNEPTEYTGDFYNLVYLRDRCMVNSGIPSTLKLYCRKEQNPVTKEWVIAKSEIAACQPNAVIPVRRAENRMNSRFCKEYPKARACQLDPSAPYTAPQGTPTPTNNQSKPVMPFDPKLNRQMQEQQFQQQMQQQSNYQMNNILRK